MDGWKKIKTFGNMYQAELRKEVLDNNDINSVIVRKKDSAFLIGEIELHVEEDNAERARIILEEFSGWIKVSSFGRLEPLDRLKEILDWHGIETIIHSDYEIADFELFVKVEDAEKAKRLLSDLPEWEKVANYEKMYQAVLRVNMLEKKGIDTLVINSIPEENKLQEINILVKLENTEKATEIINQKLGWVEVGSYKTIQDAALVEDALKQGDIEVLESIDEDTNQNIKEIKLFVPEEDEQAARDVIAETKKWEKIKAFDTLYQAEMAKDILESNDIHAVIINHKDSMFLIGDIELYVEEEDVDKAGQIIKKNQ